MEKAEKITVVIFIGSHVCVGWHLNTSQYFFYIYTYKARERIARPNGKCLRKLPTDGSTSAALTVGPVYSLLGVTECEV